MVVGLTELTLIMAGRPDVILVVFAEEAVDELVPLGREPASVMVSLPEELNICVALVDLVGDGSDLPVVLLDPEPVLSNCGIVDVNVFRRGLRSFLRGVLLCQRPC